MAAYNGRSAVFILVYIPFFYIPAPFSPRYGLPAALYGAHGTQYTRHNHGRGIVDVFTNFTLVDNNKNRLGSTVVKPGRFRC